MSPQRVIESLLPLALIFVLTILLFPMPGWFLDFCLAANIVIAFVILFVSLYVEKPIEFSVYPSLLLITTVFRLALNVATTRRILLDGNQGLDVAGELIKAFGQFLIQGNFVVGLIIFLIISIINLKVITKGAGRIAEVAARFTLDAMPGKQMSIDSDLSAGIITEQEARLRRQQLAREAEFYGAMDGAAKFVSGEALTGIFIMLLNIIGGFSIGYFQHNMSLSEATQTFTVLTVGDGLLSQIPAIIISVSAGLIVSRAASGEHFSLEILSQLGKTIWPLLFASTATVMIGLLPGLPFVPFLVTGIIVGILAYIKSRQQRKLAMQKLKEQNQKSEEPDPEKMLTTEDLLKLMEVSPIRIEIGVNLGLAIGTTAINERTRKIRFQLASRFGFICPQLYVTTTRSDRRDTKDPLKILIKGRLVFETRIDTVRVLAIMPPHQKQQENVPDLEGEIFYDPIYKIKGFLINKEDTIYAKSLHYYISDQAAQFATCVTDVLMLHMHELLRRQDVHLIISKIQKEFPRLVEDIIPQHISLAQIHQILSKLLYEFVSIRDMQTILESLGEIAPLTKNIDMMTEYVRKRVIKGSLQTLYENNLFLRVVNIDPRLEQAIRNSIIEKEDSRKFNPNQSLALPLVNRIGSLYEQELQLTSYLAVLVPQDIRQPLSMWLKEQFPRVLVISPDEIPYGLTVKAIGTIGLDDQKSEEVGNNLAVSI